MKLQLLLVLVAAANARVIENDVTSHCDGILVNGINYGKEVLKDEVNKPYQLALDYDTNKLYFSYTQEDERTVFKTAYINLKTGDFGLIEGVKGGFANAVDSKSHKIYFGGSDGIYVMEENSNTPTKTDITKKNIWQVYARDGAVYYSTYPEEDAYVYKNGKTEKVPEIGENKAMLLVVDNKQNVFYYNSSGLFVYEKSSGKTKDLDYYTVNGFSFDINDKLYFSTPTAIYTVDDKFEVKQVAKITNIYGLAIDSDKNIIYAAENSIVKLNYEGTDCGKSSKVVGH